MLRLLKIFLVNSFVFGLIYINTSYLAIGTDNASKENNTSCPMLEDVKSPLKKIVSKSVEKAIENFKMIGSKETYYSGPSYTIDKKNLHKSSFIDVFYDSKDATHCKYNITDRMKAKTIFATDSVKIKSSTSPNWSNNVAMSFDPISVDD